MNIPERLARIVSILAAMLLANTGVHAAQSEFSSSGNSAWLQEEPDFLPVDEAFVLSTAVGSDGAILARWEMPDGYYLYRHRFSFETREGSGVQLGAAEIPPGKKKVDEYFGEVEVYYHEATARVPVLRGSGTIEVGINYQGCADYGLCYPPETRWFTLSVGAKSAAVQSPPVLGLDATSPRSNTSGRVVPATEEQQLASLLSERSFLGALAIFFLAGIGLAFTPCVLPMVPILSSIIVGEAEGLNRTRAFTLSLAYVVGMALTCALVGLLVGLFGASLNLQAALQSPPVLITFAVVFVVLSFSMFGFYELQLPQSFQNAMNNLGSRVGGGKYLSVLVMGSLSSLVVSPCVSAPLAGALIYLSATGDAVLGFSALLLLGLGMGVPLMIIGASGGEFLPRAGVWMNAVKAVFGVLLLGVAIWLVERVVSPFVSLALWSALLIGSGVYLGGLDFSPRKGWGQLWKALGVFSISYGVLLLIGAASGAQDPLNPLARLGSGSSVSVAQGGVEQHELDWVAVKGLDELNEALVIAAAQNRPAMLDLYADWCISCKVMERTVFPAPEVEMHLQKFVLLRADITDNDEADKALLNRLGLFGPPSLVFFAEDGTEMRDVRVQGEIGEARLSAHLKAILENVNSRIVGKSAAKIGEIATI
ncbi:MAG: protein-disulfide reductase DsbD [Proteobacteria bacterium]|nr:protein-disulfide reductase DsbD [Pseudomonadota bacterium]